MINYSLPFDWHAFLFERVSNGAPRLTKLQNAFIDDYAQDWKYCPVGNLPAEISRTNRINHRFSNMPIDSDLCTYGAEFSLAIRRRDWKSASKLYNMIQDRANFLLKQ